MARIELDKAEFTKMWLDGKTPGAIAEHFGCCKSTVWARSKEWGIREKRVPKLSDTKEFRDAWNAGKSQVEIAKMLNCHHDYIGTLAKKYGYPPREKWTKESGAPVKPKREGVMETKVVSKQSGIHDSTMSSISLSAPPWNMESEPVSENALRAGWRKDVLEAYSSGMSVSDIAKSLWCSPVDVQYEIDRLHQSKREMGGVSYV